MEKNNAVQLSTSGRTNEIVISGLLISMVFIATKFINIRLPISVNGGLIHLGNTMLFVAAIVFGKRKGAMAGAFGMGLFDIVSGWMLWAPFTFLIRGFMGYIVGSFAYNNGRNGLNTFWNLVGIIISGIIMIIGYYITEGVLYGNWIAPMTSIPGNITQLAIGAIIGLPIAAAIKRTNLIK